jgi:putative ABC transport system ATP-binding protein
VIAVPTPVAARRAPVISARDIEVDFDSGATVRALRGVSLDVRAGELMMLMGPSGSGKTTLLQVLGCLMRPTRGTVVFCGNPLPDKSDAELARLRLAHLGFVFQHHNLFPTLTAWENVAVAMDLLGKSRRTAAERALELLSLVGLGDRAKAFPANLSGGQRQRVAIARALANDPEVILADEPTAALDTQTGVGVVQVLRRLADRGRAVVIVTHDHRLEHFSDLVIGLEDGQLASAISPRADRSPPAEVRP